MTREELQKIRSDAQTEMETPQINPYWRRAWMRLADAADCLDAIFARCEVIAVEEILPEDSRRFSEQ